MTLPPVSAVTIMVLSEYPYSDCNQTTYGLMTPSQSSICIWVILLFAGVCWCNRPEDVSDTDDQAGRLGSEQQGASGSSGDVPVSGRASQSHRHYRRAQLGRHVGVSHCQSFQIGVRVFPNLLMSVSGRALLTLLV